MVGSGAADMLRSHVLKWRRGRRTLLLLLLLEMLRHVRQSGAQVGFVPKVYLRQQRDDNVQVHLTSPRPIYPTPSHRQHKMGTESQPPMTPHQVPATAIATATALLLVLYVPTHAHEYAPHTHIHTVTATATALGLVLYVPPHE